MHDGSVEIYFLFKKFNEELNKSTYTTAANNLREMDDKNRAEELENHAKENGEDFGFESPFCKSCKGTGCKECDGSGMERNSI